MKYLKSFEQINENQHNLIINKVSDFLQDYIEILKEIGKEDQDIKRNLQKKLDTEYRDMFIKCLNLILDAYPGDLIKLTEKETEEIHTSILSFEKKRNEWKVNTENRIIDDKIGNLSTEIIGNILFFILFKPNHILKHYNMIALKSINNT